MSLTVPIIGTIYMCYNKLTWKLLRFLEHIAEHDAETIEH